MEPTDFEPMALLLIDRYSEVGNYIQWYRSQYSGTPIDAAKRFHWRSLVISELIEHDRYQLQSEYLEAGRVAVVDSDDGRTYLLRSLNHVKFNYHEVSVQLTLFPTLQYVTSPVVMLVYTIRRIDGELAIDLSWCGTKRRLGSQSLMASGTPTAIGTWIFGAGSEPPPFDTEIGDEFIDLDEDDMEGEEEA
jgi:hypothetical protein